MRGQLILGIDGGPEKCGVVHIHDAAAPSEIRLIRFGEWENDMVRDYIIDAHGLGRIDVIAMEDIRSYGMKVGKSTFETLKFMGRIQEIAFSLGIPYVEIPKKGVDGINIAICGNNNAKDPNIRAALIEVFSTPSQDAIGLKKTPGPLYGVKGHIFSALAVAMTYRMRRILEQRNGNEHRENQSRRE